MPCMQRASMMNYSHESVSCRCSVGCIGRKIQHLREWNVYVVLCEGMGIEAEELDDKDLRRGKQLRAPYKLCCRDMWAILAMPACSCFPGKYVLTKEGFQESWVLQSDPENVLRVHQLRFRMAIGTGISFGFIELEQGFDNRAHTIAVQHSNRAVVT